MISKQHGLRLETLSPPFTAIHIISDPGSGGSGYFPSALIKRGCVLDATGSYMAMLAVAGSMDLVALATIHMLSPRLQLASVANA